jgi:hypothetical protein
MKNWRRASLSAKVDLMVSFRSQMIIFRRMLLLQGRRSKDLRYMILN